MKICVLGLGYIGLPTALLLSDKHDVLGYDINPELVEKINNRILPFSEPGMDEAFFNSDMRASTKLEKSDVYIVCVPTPFDKEVKMAELRFVKNAVESLVPLLEKGNIVIIESTITPGTCEKIVTPVLERSGLKVGDDILLSHCPERAIPGNTFEEMVNNDRIVGGIDEQSTEMTAEVYRSFVKGNLYKTDARTAEFVKLMENTFRDVNIALANEFAILSEEGGIDVRDAITYANKHPRVNILNPGPGVGGHCIAVDPWFLTENTINAKLIRSAREINDSMPSYILSKAKNVLKEDNIKNPRVTIFGVAYKANIGDTRETPALKLIKLCEKEGWDIRIYDPLVKKFDYSLCSLEDAVIDSDLIIIEVGHDEFKSLDVDYISSHMANKNIIDAVNVLDYDVFSSHGFNVKNLGKS